MGKKSRRPQRQQHHHQKNHPATTLTGDSTTDKTMGTSSSKAASSATAAPAAASVPPPGNSKGADVSEVGKVKETATRTSLAAPTATVSAKEEATSGGSTQEVPEGLTAFLPKMTEFQQKLALVLCSEGQEHLFEGWSTTITEEEEDVEMSTTKKKKEMMEQLEALDQSYPDGGLKGYLTNARVLLEKSRKGINPLDGWTPSIPQGETFHLGTSHYDEIEAIGIPYLGKCAFVLVAGGLGERLGYSDIKIGLPTELATETCYIQFYIQTILAFQSKCASPNTKLPLCIMTSNDTNAKTVDLLQKNHYFGMDSDQITIVQQGQGVPALENNHAKIAMKSPYQISTKPHGHGDIHTLLYSHNVAKSWLDSGTIDYVVFFQDTNGLAFHTLPLALGLSIKLDLVMNSLAVPRKAKQAIGAITQLTNPSGEQRTVNVEYNQLDPLLRSSGFPEGDVNDPNTGLSPYPGNINQLLFALRPYVEVLERTKGAMPEFVNPKYKDSTKTDFKSPTRLECMMQDFPVVLDGETAKRVGFTCVDADICFSPVKNALSDGVALQDKGISPGVAASGEADQYGAQAKILRSIGCVVGESSLDSFNGISVHLSPSIVLKPNFVTCPGDYKAKFPFPTLVEVSARSSLVVEGEHIIIKSLDLDGALVIKSEEGAPMGTIDGVVVNNRGWVWEEVATTNESEEAPTEVIRMRGYQLKKLETCTIIFKKDGTVEGLPEISKPPQDLTRPSPGSETEKMTCGCVIV